MSGLKSSWELSLEKSDKLNPDLKKRRKLTDTEKKEIAEIRKEYHAKIADRDVSIQHQIKKLAERIPPESLEPETQTLRSKFAEEKQILEKEMEDKIEDVHNRNK